MLVTIQLFLRFVYFERERKKGERGRGREWEREGGSEGQKEWERENPQADFMLSVEPNVGAQSHDPNTMTWAETKRQMLNGLRHTGAPFLFLIDLIENSLFKILIATMYPLMYAYVYMPTYAYI